MIFTLRRSPPPIFPAASLDTARPSVTSGLIASLAEEDATPTPVEVDHSWLTVHAGGLTMFTQRHMPT